jgi:hypothetical protein
MPTHHADPSQILGQLMLLGYIPPAIGPERSFWRDHGPWLGALAALASLGAFVVARYRRRDATSRLHRPAARDAADGLHRP